MNAIKHSLLVTATVLFLSACSGDGSTPYNDFGAGANQVGVSTIQASGTKSGSAQDIAVKNVAAATITVE